MQYFTISVQQTPVRGGKSHDMVARKMGAEKSVGGGVPDAPFVSRRERLKNTHKLPTLSSFDPRYSLRRTGGGAAALDFSAQSSADFGRVIDPPLRGGQIFPRNHQAAAGARPRPTVLISAGRRPGKCCRPAACPRKIPLPAPLRKWECSGRSVPRQRPGCRSAVPP